MLEAAVAAQGAMRMAAVSVLTSHSPESYWESRGSAVDADLLTEVLRLATVATEAGVGAIVASPQEVEAVRGLVGPEPWVVTPGIRPAGFGLDDQRRTATPEAAAAAGATHLVVGRPITRAENPRAVYDSICEAVT
jgi:orotidine-5'-phosphate decarboxylase